MTAKRKRSNQGGKARRPFLPFKNNLVFRRVMRDPDTAKQFLELVLGIRIDHLEYVNTEQVIDMDLDAKSIRLDLYAKGAERIYNVEMQAQDYADLGKRMAYYQAGISSRALERGADARDMPESFIIFLCADDPFELGEPVYRFDMRCREAASLVLDTGFHWLALNAEGYAAEPDRAMRNLLRYVRTQEVAEGDAFVERIDERVRKVNDDENWVNMAIRLMTIEEDAVWRGERIGMQRGMQRGMEQGLEKGMEQGLEQGMQQGLEQGFEQGMEKGESRYNALVQKLIAEDRMDDLKRATADPAYRESLFEEFAIA